MRVALIGRRKPDAQEQTVRGRYVGDGGPVPIFEIRVDLLLQVMDSAPWRDRPTPLAVP